MFVEKIKESYRINWVVDNLPAVTKHLIMPNSDSSKEENDQGFAVLYEKGFPIGSIVTPQDVIDQPVGTPILFNHLRINMFIHEHESTNEALKDSARIVGCEIEAFSVKHQIDGANKGVNTKLTTCSSDKAVTGNTHALAIGSLSKSLEVIWTYDITWTKSDIKWASRWDIYLRMQNSSVHWFSIFSSVMFVLFLSGIFVTIMMRTLNNDFVRYNNFVDETENGVSPLDETGWKLVHGDVFRPPSRGQLLAVFVGTGVQLIAMILITLFFALIGLLSPANRGWLFSSMIFMFVLMAAFNGYASASTHSMFKLTDFNQHVWYSACFFPAIVCSITFLMNLFVWYAGSSKAVPLTTMLMLFVLWFFVSVPLVYLGAFISKNRPTFEPPVKVNTLPRGIYTSLPWYAHPIVSILIGGLAPFLAVAIEIFFVLNSIWQNQFYYIFGVLFITFCMLAIISAEVSMVFCYFSLCGEDYHWWWRSFLTPASSALYVFLFSLFYYYSQLELDGWIPNMVYFGNVFLLSFAFFLVTGTIGYFASFWFVNKIYSSIKID
jgi:transmembrane 9 superfamily protein 2/4